MWLKVTQVLGSGGKVLDSGFENLDSMRKPSIQGNVSHTLGVLKPLY